MANMAAEARLAVPMPRWLCWTWNSAVRREMTRRSEPDRDGLLLRAVRLALRRIRDTCLFRSERGQAVPRTSWFSPAVRTLPAG
jgi:hypothetical protein